MTTSNRNLAAAAALLLAAACAGPSQSVSQGARASVQNPVPQKSNVGAEDQQNPEGPAGAQLPAGGAHAGMGGGMAGKCPIALPGTKVEASDTQDGVALTFTNPAQVDELRTRVRAAAAHHAHMAGAHGGMGSGSDAGGGRAMMTASARAEDVEGGARLVLTPRDPSGAQTLRSEVREHAEQMSSGGGCPMSMGR
jgi:hypothetical protein